MTGIPFGEAHRPRWISLSQGLGWDGLGLRSCMEPGRLACFSGSGDRAVRGGRGSAIHARRVLRHVSALRPGPACEVIDILRFKHKGSGGWCTGSPPFGRASMPTREDFPDPCNCLPLRPKPLSPLPTATCGPQSTRHAACGELLFPGPWTLLELILPHRRGTKGRLGAEPTCFRFPADRKRKGWSGELFLDA